MDLKQKHLALIKDKGRFTVDCSHAIFSLEEIEILEKWGHWFMALTQEALSPISELQKAFVEVAQGRQDPFSIEEKAWFKYLNRKRLEKEEVDKLNIHYELSGDSFYSREDVKKLRGTMYHVIKETHRK